MLQRIISMYLMQSDERRKKAGWSRQGGEPMAPKLPGRQINPALQANSHMAKKEEMSDGIPEERAPRGPNEGSTTASPVPSAAVSNCSIPDLNPITDQI